MKKDILGIKVDDININQALEIVLGWLSKPGKYYIVTPNPEIVVMAQKDKELKEIINKADLAIPDGNGLRFTTDIVCNTPGIDLMEALIKMAAENGFAVGLLGGRDEVAEKVRERLLKKYPKLKIAFADSGGEVNEEGKLLKDLKLLNCDILFVAFGQPKQEKWVENNLSKIDVKVVMVVGGGFDYLSGRIKRAPVWVRNLNLEWLFRLIIQPWRIRRQLSLLKYIWLLTKERFGMLS